MWTVFFLLLLNSVFDKLICCTIGPKSFLFGTAQFSLWLSGAVNHDYIVTNSIKSLLTGSRCIPNGAHTNHCWANLANDSKSTQVYCPDKAGCQTHCLNNLCILGVIQIDYYNYATWLNNIVIVCNQSSWFSPGF